MTQPTVEPFKRKVVLSVPRRFDLDIHVSEITVEDGVYADVREFIPSMSQYGRGILLPIRSLREITAALEGIAEHVLGEPVRE